MPPNRVLVDSSFLFGLYDRDSADYAEIRAITGSFKGQFLVPQISLTEVIYLLKRDYGVRGAARFLREFGNTQSELLDITLTDLLRASEIMEQYASADFDFVDCCIMALSERLNIRVVFTLDNRDFSIFRPRHCDYLRILPAQPS